MGLPNSAAGPDCVKIQKWPREVDLEPPGFSVEVRVCLGSVMWPAPLQRNFIGCLNIISGSEQPKSFHAVSVESDHQTSLKPSSGIGRDAAIRVRALSIIQFKFPATSSLTAEGLFSYCHLC